MEKKLGKCKMGELTPREIEVMFLLAEGGTYDSVGKKLVISKDTVKHHVRKLLHKTGYRNSVELIAHAVAAKVIMVQDD